MQVCIFIAFLVANELLHKIEDIEFTKISS